MSRNLSSKKSVNRLLIWGIGVSFVLFQFFLQLSSGVVIGSIMNEFRLSALQAGSLSAAFYIVYTGLQIPVGILFDKKSTRLLLSTNAFICSLGCFLFATAHSIWGLFIGRLLIGSGAAFAFIGLSHLLRQHYPLKQFAYMIGLSETLGFIVTMIGMISLGSLITQWGWRGFIGSAGIVGSLISFLCWKYVPYSKPSQSHNRSHWQQLLSILKNKYAWINGLFVGLSFTVVTAFGALWAVPFIQVKLACSLKMASIVCSAFFLGTAVSCPLFGLLSNRFKRKPLIFTSCLSTSFLLFVLIYIPSTDVFFTTSMLFLIGGCCGAYMLAYTISNEIAPAGCLSTCTGFTNTLAVITTPLLQPFIGYLLDQSHQTGGAYTLGNYQQALVTIPLSLLLATLLISFLPDKK